MQVDKIKLRRPALPFLLLLLGIAAMTLLSCQLTQEAKEVNTLSFTALYDSLSRYDSVTIVVKDQGSRSADTLFKGKVNAVSKIQNLTAPHYTGKTAIIEIRGYDAGILVSQVDRTFDGAKDSTLAVEVKVIPKDTTPVATVPDLPAISSLIPGDAKVTVTWAAVPGAVEYDLYYGEGGAVDKSSTRVKKVTSPWEVKALKNGATYAFALNAMNSAGESGLGAVQTAAPQAAPVNSPAIDSATGGNGRVTFTWASLPEALGYVLYYRAGSTVDKTGTRITGIYSPYALTGLANGTQYAFAITALTAAGETGLSNIVTVTPQAPPVGSLSYAANPAVYWTSVPITPNPATITGAVDSFTISPSLPPGLALDKATGGISGTPTAASARTDYTVKAKTPGGESTALLSLTVNGAPSGLQYKDNPAVYWQSAAIATNSATVSGIVDSFTVSPALPAGLTLSKSTGAISGTPSAISASARYTVTAHNPAGTSSVEITLLVNGPPSGFNYSLNPAVYYQYVAIAPNAATLSGTVDSFTVTPALPAGLSLNKTTGAITGTPTASSSATAYTVTARNAAGSPTVTLTLTVKGPPTGLSYSTPNPVYLKSIPIAANSASVTGTVDSFTVSPALPAGLSLNKTTGAITGTPTAIAAAATYSVTARNPSGSTAFNLNITVNNPITGLSYAVNPAVYWKGVALSPPNTPTITGTPDSFTVSPALPAGMSLDKSTGAITGAPTVAAAQAVYVLTAYAGTVTAAANLTLTVHGPPVITYAVQAASYTQGTAIVSNTVSATPAGTVDSFKVAPALPAGLSISKSTGTVSGTPTATAAAANFVVTAWNKAGFGMDTISIAVTAPASTVTLKVQAETGLDTTHLTGYNGGFAPSTYIAKPGQPYFGVYRFNLSAASPTGLASAKVRFRSYGVGPGWNGGAKNLTFKIYRLKSDWTEGTGNWYWHRAAYQNNGAVILANYLYSDYIKNNSTDPADSSGLRSTQHYIVRSENLILAQSEAKTISFPAASIHTDFSTPIPGPANLVDLELDMTDYVKGILNGTYTDYGFTLVVEGLPSDAVDWITVIHKEAGDGNADESDGNHGARMILQY